MVVVMQFYGPLPMLRGRVKTLVKHQNGCYAEYD